jgi:hypothetical protein
MGTPQRQPKKPTKPQATATRWMKRTTWLSL